MQVCHLSPLQARYYYIEPAAFAKCPKPGGWDTFMDCRPWGYRGCFGRGQSDLDCYRLWSMNLKHEQDAREAQVAK